MSADVTELDGLASDLAKAPAEALTRSRVVVQKSTADIKRDAQIGAPVDTGNLRNSIGYRTTISATSTDGEVGPTAAYGAFVEDGTSRMAPQPYMGPAFDRNAPLFIQAMEALGAEVIS